MTEPCDQVPQDRRAAPGLMHLGGCRVGDAQRQADPELKLLLACARTTLRPADREDIDTLTAKALDWQRFLGLAIRHRLAPLAWRHLKTSDRVPPQALADLNILFKRNSLNGLKQGGELIRLARCFEAAGIRLLPLKGLVLAAESYGSTTLRHVGDLDLLVESAAIADADRLLQEQGYIRLAPDYPLTPAQETAYRTIRKDFTYKHPYNETVIELHWRLSQNAQLLPLSMDELWPGRTFVRIGNHDIATLPRALHFSYLCAHGAHTAWFRLKWLCDIAEFIRDASDEDIAGLVDRAEALGTLRMVAQALTLAQNALGTPWPNALPADAGQSRTVRELVDVAEQAMHEDALYWNEEDMPFSWMWKQARYRSQLRSNLRYKLHGAWFYSLWTDECRSLRLPKALYPLYFPWALAMRVVSLFR